MKKCHFKKIKKFILPVGSFIASLNEQMENGKGFEISIIGGDFWIFRKNLQHPIKHFSSQAICYSGVFQQI